MGKDELETLHWEILSLSVDLSQIQGVFGTHQNDQTDFPVINLLTRPIFVH